MKLIDITGWTFGRLTIVGRGFNEPGRHTRWNYLCDCGNVGTSTYQNLTRGKSTSCGCFSREQTVERFTKHGHAVHMHGRNGTSQSRTYKSWLGMNARCYNCPKKDEKYYLNRGIQVCLRWHRGTKNAFRNFLSDMGECPSGLSIDRVNPRGHYMPSNCRWATPQQQSENRIWE
jgi:hypothetical protein